VATNVRGGHLMWPRMSGPVKNRVGTNVRGNEYPYTEYDICGLYQQNTIDLFVKSMNKTRTQ